MVCAELSGATWHRPAAPVEVRDVCGAGDTVFAALAVAMIAGKSFRDACRAAMGAAERQVAAVGIASVGRDRVDKQRSGHKPRLPFLGERPDAAYQGNPAAAKNLRFQNPPDPPLGLTALFGDSHFSFPRPTVKATS